MCKFVVILVECGYSNRLERFEIPWFTFSLTPLRPEARSTVTHLSVPVRRLGTVTILDLRQGGFKCTTSGLGTLLFTDEFGGSDTMKQSRRICLIMSDEWVQFSRVEHFTFKLKTNKQGPFKNMSRSSPVQVTSEWPQPPFVRHIGSTFLSHVRVVPRGATSVYMV